MIALTAASLLYIVHHYNPVRIAAIPRLLCRRLQGDKIKKNLKIIIIACAFNMNLWSKFPISEASEQEVGALREKFM